MHLATIIGFLGSFTSCCMFLPQAIRVIRRRDNRVELMGVSVMSKIMAMTNSVLWVTYAILIHDLWIGVPGVINFFVNAVTVWIVVKAHRELDVPVSVIESGE